MELARLARMCGYYSGVRVTLVAPFEMQYRYVVEKVRYTTITYNRSKPY